MCVRVGVEGVAPARAAPRATAATHNKKHSTRRRQTLHPTITKTNKRKTQKVEAVGLAAFYEHRLQGGAKAVFHLEAFVAKFMSAYKNWTVATME